MQADRAAGPSARLDKGRTADRNKLNQKPTRLTQDLHDVLEESARPISSEVRELKTHMETRLDNMEIKLADTYILD